MLLNFAILSGKWQKNAPFHIKSPVKNFHGRAKGGRRTVLPLNTPLSVCMSVRLSHSCMKQLDGIMSLRGSCCFHNGQGNLGRKTFNTFYSVKTLFSVFTKLYLKFSKNRKSVVTE